jgi:hypothetical protein
VTIDVDAADKVQLAFADNEPIAPPPVVQEI